MFSTRLLERIRATIADLSVLADGLLVISAVQTDAAGNTQIIPTELTVVLDRIAPNAPSLTIRDNVSSPLTLGETTDTNGVVNVLGENGAAIAVSFSGQNGGFTKNLTGTGFNQAIALDASEAAILGEGSVAITATQTDAAGNTSIQETLSVVIEPLKFLHSRLMHKLASMEKATRYHFLEHFLKRLFQAKYSESC